MVPKRKALKPDHFDNEIRLPEHTCPYCKAKLDAMSGPTKQAHAGDVSLCMYCAGIMIITDGDPRCATPEEEMDLLKDPVIIAIESAIRQVQAARRKEEEDARK